MGQAAFGMTLLDFVQQAASFAGSVWPILVIGALYAGCRLNRTGHRALIEKAATRQGFRVIRISPLSAGEAELNLNHARTRSGGRYYYLVVEADSVAQKQIWMVESGRVLRIS